MQQDQKTITISFLLDWEDSSHSIEFDVRVPLEWMETPESRDAMYEAFRRDMVVDIESVCCAECGEDYEEDTAHSCDDDDEEDAA